MAFRAFLLPSILVVGSLFSLSCSKQTPEAQVKKAFKACVEALEAGDVPKVAEFMAPGFQGPRSMRRQEALFFLMGVTRREKVRVTVFSEDAELKGADVFQRVEVMLSARSGHSLMPDDMSRKTFLLRWEKDGGDWKIREVREE